MFSAAGVRGALAVRVEAGHAAASRGPDPPGRGTEGDGVDMGTKRTVVGLASALLLVAVGAGGASAFAGGGRSAAPKPESAPVVGADGNLVAGKDGPQNLASNGSTEFHPVTACRIVSTKGHGGPLGATTTRSYFVVGGVNFQPQGGHQGGCGIPVGATQIVARLTAVIKYRHQAASSSASPTVLHVLEANGSAVIPVLWTCKHRLLGLRR